MTNFLYIMRHGEAIDGSETVSDAERSLTDKGKASCVNVRHQLFQLFPKPDIILSSPLVRAKQTADKMAEDNPKKIPISLTDDLGLESGTGHLLKLLHTHQKKHALLLVGHEPQLWALIKHLLGRSMPKDFLLKKSGCVVLELSQENENSAFFVAYLIPKDSDQSALESLAPDDILTAESEKKIKKKLSMLLLNHWKNIRRLKIIVLKNFEHEDIHDFRVALRRFRILLSIARLLSSLDHKNTLQKTIHQQIKSMNSIRNLDEAIVFFKNSAARTQAKLHRNIEKQLHEKRAEARRDFKTSLDRFKLHQFNEVIRDFARHILTEKKRNISTAWSCYLNRLLRFYPKTQKKIASLQKGNTNTLHRLRIALRKWRYFLEFDEALQETNHSAMVQLLKNHQTILGKLNDLAVFKELSKELDIPKEEYKYLVQLFENHDEIYGLSNFSNIKIWKQ